LDIEHLGHVRVDKITRALANGCIAKRQAAGRSGRTVDLEVTCFRNMMNRAVDDGWLTIFPTLNLHPLKWPAKKRSLLQTEDLEKLCEVAVKDESFKNGRGFADYMKLMASCGGRRDETLRLNWERKQLTIGSDGMAKIRKARVVDFNEKLEAHLEDTCLLGVRCKCAGNIWPRKRQGS
jgi:site-specific recombinase XerC